MMLELAKKFADVRERHRALSEQMKVLDAEWVEVETALLEAMAEEGVKSFKTDDGMFSFVTTNYLSVTAANKEQFFPYLKQSGNGALLKEDVNPRTLTAFLKEHLEDVKKGYEASGMDPIEARNKALEFLNQKGASYFTKREVRMAKK